METCSREGVIKEDRFPNTRLGLVDSAAAAAAAIAAALGEKDMLSGRSSGGTQQYFVTDSTDRFSSVASLFLGGCVDGAVRRVDITD